MAVYLAFKPSLQNGHCIPEILALPDTQERSEYAGDIGSDPADLRRLCDEAGWKVNLSLVQKGWNDKSRDGHGRRPPKQSKLEPEMQGELSGRGSQKCRSKVKTRHR